MASARLPEPKRKPCRRRPEQPYPVPIQSYSGVPASNNIWKWYEGTFIGLCVTVDDEESIKILYLNGFFGKSNLSERIPKCAIRSPNELPPVIRQRQLERRKEWASLNVDSDDDEEGSEKRSNEEQGKVVVIRDSDSEDEAEPSLESLKPTLTTSPWSLPEELYLNLEEAFFLSYGLGTLVVKTIHGHSMDILSMWKHYCLAREDFPFKFAVYHYFRCKGWVVGIGLKYGVDYLLYKQGPAFYHATYAVVVNWIHQEQSSPSLTPRDITGLQRISNSAGKELLIATVHVPEDLTEENLQNPNCIKKFEIQELLLSRWVPSENRSKEEDKPV